MPPVSELYDIVVFGLLFVATAALANGLSVTPQMVLAPLKAHSQAAGMALIANFIIVPALTLGFLLAFDFNTQATIAFALLCLVAGAPFVAWMTSLGSGDIPYGASASFMLMIGTIIIMPLALPNMLDVLDTNVELSRWKLLWPILLFLVVPLVVGLVIRARYPKAAMAGASWLGPISLAALAVHICLMFAAYWDDFIDEFGTGEIAFTIAFPIACLLIGLVLCPPYVLSPMKPADTQSHLKLSQMIATGQKGSQPLICSLIFALGAFPVAGVVALASSVITIVIIVFVSLETGKRAARHASPTAEVAPSTARPAA